MTRSWRLADWAGVKGEDLHKVVSTSSGGSVITSGALETVMDRRSEGSGSHIGTMQMDLRISLGLARELGVLLALSVLLIWPSIVTLLQ